MNNIINKYKEIVGKSSNLVYTINYVLYYFILLNIFIPYNLKGVTDTNDISLNDSINGIYIPIDLEDCFRNLNSMLSDSTKNRIKILSEIEFSREAHLSLGMWLRNNWGLWHGSRLYIYFNKMGIQHPDNVSGIIIVSYHRYLNGKNIDISSQIKYYTDLYNLPEDYYSIRAMTVDKMFYNNLDSIKKYKEIIIDVTLNNRKDLPKILGELNNLKSLTIENSPELDFDLAFKTISNFKNIEELHLFDNEVFNYPNSIGLMTQLKDLWLNGDSIKIIPFEIRDLKNLTDFGITSCPNINVDSVVNIIFELKNLIFLNLSENNLSDLPINTNLLSNLETLFISENKFKDIPKSIKSLKNLKRLVIDMNELESIDIKINELQSLKYINLSYNRFTEFPKDLINLKNLIEIDIWYNEIKTIPYEINGLTKLTTINIKYNDLNEEYREKIQSLFPKIKIWY